MTSTEILKNLSSVSQNAVFLKWDLVIQHMNSFKIHAGYTKNNMEIVIAKLLENMDLWLPRLFRKGQLFIYFCPNFSKSFWMLQEVTSGGQNKMKADLLTT